MWNLARIAYEHTEWMEKEASIQAIRKKKYFQMLERLHGGKKQLQEYLASRTERTLPSIYHATSAENAEKIMNQGMQVQPPRVVSPNPLDGYPYYGRGNFFGDEAVTPYGDTILRLAKPHELTQTKILYPNINKTMVVNTPTNTPQDVETVISGPLMDFRQYHNLNFQQFDDMLEATNIHHLRHYGKIGEQRILDASRITPRWKNTERNQFLIDENIPPELLKVVDKKK